MTAPRDGSGLLFRSDRQDNERAPSHTGSITIDGKVYELAAWVKEGRTGKFFSLSVRPKQEHAAPRRGTKPSQAAIARTEAVRRRTPF